MCRDYISFLELDARTGMKNDSLATVAAVDLFCVTPCSLLSFAREHQHDGTKIYAHFGLITTTYANAQKCIASNSAKKDKLAADVLLITSNRFPLLDI